MLGPTVSADIHRSLDSLPRLIPSFCIQSIAERYSLSRAGQQLFGIGIIEIQVIMILIIINTNLTENGKIRLSNGTGTD